MFSKKTLVGIAFTSVLAIGFTIGGATYAIFTDSATNRNNSFKTGSIILEQNRDHGDTISFPGPMFYSAKSDPTGHFPYDRPKSDSSESSALGGEDVGGWAPGDIATRAMNIYNKGTLKAKITKLKATVNPKGVTSGDAYNEFTDKMNIKVTYLSTTLYDGKISELLNGVNIITPIIAVPNSEPVNIAFTASLSKDTGNIIQGKDFIFDFTFSGEQIKNK
ncbi:CalY family protein [Clostridium sp. SHJSY1]|uniref:hypothetical protein n=1 Tax=Clostridium sp. SHJSY1 TaxID=2942483 RepID=UPI002875A078|nr:hypothetical protein [Clostridium sp. SHJSY1]MDS0527438.1 CalY family protein [Clostridium sp. SHJSY1]